MRNILILFFISLFTFSCTNLDEEIYDKIPADQFPENENQAALAVVPTYQELKDLIDDAGWWFWCQETSSDEVVFPVRLTDWEDGGKWRVLHQHAWDNNTDGINSMWSHLYDGVVAANLAIDELGPNSTEESALITIAKLKTLRAFYYYLLIDNYGDVPYVTSFFDAPAQPMKEDRAVIWESLIRDLEESLLYLPEAANKFAVSKGMAFSLLAKLYLNAEVYTGTAQWKEAENYCDSVINLNLYSLEANPLGPFVTNNDNSPENIFTIPFDEINFQGFRIHMRTLHYQHNLTYDMPVGTWNGFATVEDHYNLYSDDDLRKEGFIVGPQFASNGQPLYDETAEADVVINPEIPALVMDASYSFEQIRMSGARVGKFEIKKGALENLSNDFPLFRYADILLMKAECVIRQGGNGDSWVNEVRNRAGLGNWSGTSLDMLLEERGRELFCEGHRRQDQIRFGKFNDSWWEKDVSAPSRNTFPIPQWAIDANPNLGG
jgi:hypothetical protein